MAYRKLSRGQVWRLFLVSVAIGVCVGVYYILSPYQQCRRDIRISQPDAQEEDIIDECMKQTAG